LSSATTIIFAREDLSIPGAPQVQADPEAVQARFFSLVRKSKPDVMVLDVSRAPSAGIETIHTIRRRTDIPIVVVCDPAHPLTDEYQRAGADDCIPAPVDFLCLDQSVKKIIHALQRGIEAMRETSERVWFSGMNFQPHRNVLVGEEGTIVELTSSQGRLLGHFLSKPRTLCSQGEIGELLYGHNHNVGGPALDGAVNRLRKKLGLIGGPAAERLIRTEVRRGYTFLADVVTRAEGRRPAADVA